MKPEKYRFVVLVVVAIAIGGAVWWFTRTPGNTAAANTPVASAAKADAPKAVTQAAPVAQVELPKAAVVAAKPETADSQSDNIALARAELKATVQDMASVLREKGMYSYMLNYLPPGFAENQSPDDMRNGLRLQDATSQDPQVQQIRDLLARHYDYLATLTPTLNARGDQATYYDPDADKAGANHDDSDSIIVRLMKVDGKWHLYTVPGDDPATPFPP